MPDYLRRDAELLEAIRRNNDGSISVLDPQGYEFTNTWFAENNQAVFDTTLVPFLDEVVVPAIGHDLRYLEIGVNEGASMIWALHCLDLIRAVGVDSYRISSGPRHEERQKSLTNSRRLMLQNIALAEKNLNLREGFVDLHFVVSRHFLMQAAENTRTSVFQPTDNEPESPYFDLIYVDGDHSGSGTMRDLVLSFDVLAVGGVIVIDDLNRRWNKGKPQTREAFEGWFSAYENHLEPVYRDKRIAIVQKVKA